MKIGNLELAGNVFLAPMAGITDPPFRKIVQQFGVSAVWTEMLSADGVAKARGTFRTMEISDRKVPTVFQIVGTDPAVMAEAAKQDSRPGGGGGRREHGLSCKKGREPRRRSGLNEESRACRPDCGCDATGLDCPSHGQDQVGVGRREPECRGYGTRDRGRRCERSDCALSQSIQCSFRASVFGCSGRGQAVSSHTGNR